MHDISSIIIANYLLNLEQQCSLLIPYNIVQEVLLLRHEISIKKFCEKVKFSNGDFCRNFCDYEWTYKKKKSCKLFKNTLHYVQTKGNGAINKGLT